MAAYTSSWDPDPAGALHLDLAGGDWYRKGDTPGGGPPSAAPGSSYNESFLPNYDEEKFLLELAKQAGQLANTQYQWGQQQYQRNQRLTDQLLAEANSYASTERQKFEMGRAGARTAQSMEAQRANLLRDLESFGIDPSAGRYAGLIAAERTQQGAAVAGSENAARAATEATGRELKGRAAQSQAQTSALGSQMMGRPDQWASLAASLRYPPLGNRGASASRLPMSGASSSGGGGGGKQGGGGGGPGGGYGGGGGSRPGFSGMGGADRAINPGYMHYGGSGGGAGAAIYGTGDYGGDYSSAPSYDQWTGDYGNTSWDQALANPAQDFWQGYGSGYAPSYDQWTGDYGNTSWDQATSGGYGDYGGANTWAGYGSGESPGYSDWGSWDTGASWDSSGADSWGSGAEDLSGSGYGGFDFEGGGDVPTTGGHVDYSLSPSAGAETDDVPAMVSDGGTARLNAGEFVVPRDVKDWLGEKYFQDLIKKSREARGVAPAKPSKSYV